MALPFWGLAITLSAWSLVYGIQLGYGTLAEQLVWQRVTLGVAGFVPTLWLFFALAYTRREDWLNRNYVLLFLAEPVAFFLLSLTNPYHELVWTTAVMTSTAIGDVPALEFGAGYAIHIVYVYAVVAVGIGRLLIYGTQVAPMYQKQVLLLITGATPPFISHVAFTLGASPIPSLDLTPFVFGFTGVILGLALFRFELLKLAPIARGQSLKEVGDGLVVVNNNDEIVDLLGVATDVLEPTPRVGDPISKVFSDTSLEELDRSERAASIDGQRRVFQFRVSSLTAHHSRQVGTILRMRDITGLRESEQRLSVSNRVLRHNLQNDMTVVLGYANLLESRLSGQDAQYAQKVRETVEDFLELIEKAKQITQLHDIAEERETTIDAVQQLRAVVSELQSDYPATEFRMVTANEALTGVVDSEAFRLAIQNVVDNAAKHNDATDSWVEIAMERTGNETRIEISDNGPGIPEIEWKAIESGVETPLVHSQGLGLWLTYWCVTTWGGELRFDSDSDGSTVTITVPWSLSSASTDTSDGDVAA